MKIRKLAGNKFKVESSSKGKFYTVDLNAPSCTCAHFLFRLRSTGEKCKHIDAAEQHSARQKKSKSVKPKGKSPKSKQKSRKKLASFSKIMEEIKSNGEIDTIELMEKYGEDKVQELIDNGELIEHMGKLRVLE